MPIVQVNLIAGYDESTRIDMADRLTRAIRATIAAPVDGITVVLNEVPPANYMRGHRSAADASLTPGQISPGAPVPNAEQTVRGFLDAMTARNLDRAKRYLDHQFRMEFPGPVRFTQLEELVAWSASRYRRIGKTYERFESVWQMEQTVVWCYGQLDGQWPDGQDFSGVRFVDRFTVEHGKLVDQTVWNDLAETRGNS